MAISAERRMLGRDQRVDLDAAVARACRPAVAYVPRQPSGSPASRSPPRKRLAGRRIAEREVRRRLGDRVARRDGEQGAHAPRRPPRAGRAGRGSPPAGGGRPGRSGRSRSARRAHSAASACRPRDEVGEAEGGGEVEHRRVHRAQPHRPLEAARSRSAGRRRRPAPAAEEQHLRRVGRERQRAVGRRQPGVVVPGEEGERVRRPRPARSGRPRRRPPPPRGRSRTASARSPSSAQPCVKRRVCRPASAPLAAAKPGSMATARRSRRSASSLPSRVGEAAAAGRAGRGRRPSGSRSAAPARAPPRPAGGSARSRRPPPR